MKEVDGWKKWKEMEGARERIYVSAAKQIEAAVERLSQVLEQDALSKAENTQLLSMIWSQNIHQSHQIDQVLDFSEQGIGLTKQLVEQMSWHTLLLCMSLMSVLVCVLFIIIQYLARLRVKHAASPSRELNFQAIGLPRRPKDVFLCFTGAQRLVAVNAPGEFFENGNLGVFFDMNMRPDVIGPRDTMRFHLETCRHIVVVISQAFLERRDPRDELEYAFRRMQYIRRQDRNWQSLWVVLYDLSLKEYKTARELYPNLPDLGNDVVIEKFHGKFRTWSSLCLKLKADIVAEDEDRAVLHWHTYLEQWPECPPRADRVYAD